MAKCFSCYKELGLFSEKTSRLVQNKKEKFCLTCAEEWDQKIKQQTISDLYKDGDLEEVFTIPTVRTWDLSGRLFGSNEIEYFGDLVFTNKALIFAQFEELNLKKTGKVVATFGGFLEKFVTGVMVEVQNISVRRKVEGGLCSSFKINQNFFHSAKHIIVIPRDKIRKVEFGNITKRLSIFVDYYTYFFGFRDDRKEVYNDFKDRIENYLVIKN